MARWATFASTRAMRNVGQPLPIWVALMPK
jgi:hypothetical protein